MGIKLTDGLTINSQAQGDDRFSYPTVEAALVDGWTATIAGAPVNIGRISAQRRYEGLAVWITSEKKLYRFIGGTNPEHFVPDMAATEVIETILTEIKENFLETLISEEFLKTLIEKLFEVTEIQEKFLETLIEKLFESPDIQEKFLETLIQSDFSETLFASDEFTDAMKAYWSKKELKVMTEEEFEAASDIPSGTVVMIKKD